jgi:hypothetical protein
MLKPTFIFEKRAANLLRMYKIAFSTLKSVLDFNNKTLRKQPLMKYFKNLME